MKKEETNGVTVAAGFKSVADMKDANLEFALSNMKMNDNLWAIPLTEEDVATCVGLGKYPANGLSFQKKDYTVALSCECPLKTVIEMFEEGFFRLLVLLDYEPASVDGHQPTSMAPISREDFLFNQAQSYMGVIKGEISLNKWVSIEHLHNGSWHPTNLMALAYEKKRQATEMAMADMKKETHSILVKKEAEITELMRENSTLAARFNLERAQIIQARDLTKSHNLYLMNALERLSGDNLLLENMTLTEDLGMKRLELDIALEEKCNIERQRNDLKRKNDYLEGLLRQHGIFNHNMPPTQPAALAA